MARLSWALLATALLGLASAARMPEQVSSAPALYACTNALMCINMGVVAGSTTPDSGIA